MYKRIESSIRSKIGRKESGYDLLQKHYSNIVFDY